MTAHLCAHPGVCSTPKLGGTAKKWGRGTEKFFSGASRRNSCPHFQFASGASDHSPLQLDQGQCIWYIIVRISQQNSLHKNVPAASELQNLLDIFGGPEDDSFAKQA